MKTITRDALRRRLQESPGRVVLVDVRDRADFEAGHIKGAISIPDHELSMRAEKEFGKDHEIILYCGNFECQASATAAKTLAAQGFKDVLDYEGGLRDWQAAGFMTEGTHAAKAA